MKLLAIDYGKKRIGLAVGSVIPKGIGVLDGAKPLEQIIEGIQKLIAEHEVEKIVLGMPYRSQGEKGTLAGEIEDFGKKLSEMTGLTIDYEPEEFTSVEAAQTLKDFGQKNYDKGKIDEIAAVILLEQYIKSKEDN